MYTVNTAFVPANFYASKNKVGTGGGGGSGNQVQDTSGNIIQDTSGNTVTDTN